MPQRWVVNNGAPFALSTSAKTFLGVIAGAADVINALTEISVSIDTTANCLAELCESTQAGAGTPGAAGAASYIKQVGGFTDVTDTAPAQVTSGGNYTAEPTVLTRLKAWRFTGPGPFLLQSPLGREVSSLKSGSTKFRALFLRLTASVGTPNADGYIEWE